MIVQRISSNKAANNLYIFNNNNYSQVKNASVSPIKPVKELAGLAGKEDKKEPAAIYKNDKESSEIQASGMKQIDAIKNEYASSEKVDYNTDSIYERKRMATEGTVLLGMNYDEFV